jgi:hypothetical protein
VGVGHQGAIEISTACEKGGTIIDPALRVALVSYSVRLVASVTVRVAVNKSLAEVLRIQLPIT